MSDPGIITDKPLDLQKLNNPSSRTSDGKTSSDAEFEKELKDSQEKLEDRMVRGVGGMVPMLDMSKFFFFGDKLSSDVSSPEKINDRPREVEASSPSSGSGSPLKEGKKDHAAKSEAGTPGGQVKAMSESVQKPADKGSVAFNLVPMSTFLRGLEKAGKAEARLIAEKIVESAKLLGPKDKKELVIELKPDWLGSVTINLTNEKGVINIAITAAQDAKQLIDEQMNELESALKASNLNIGSLNVSVSGGSSGGTGESDDSDGIIPAENAKNLSPSPVYMEYNFVDREMLERSLGFRDMNSTYTDA